MIPDDLTIIFVTGLQRAGTTLLAGLLSGGEAYPMLPECTYLRDAIASYVRSQTPATAQKTRAYLSDGVSLYRDLVRGMVDNAIVFTGAPPRKFLVLKDPKMAGLLSQAPALLSNPLRSVVIVRDPRDVVASMVDVIRRKDANAEKAVTQAMRAALQQFDQVSAALASPHPRNPILLVRYEDIVSGDANICDKIDAFVGYEVDRGGFREADLLRLDVENDPWATPYYGGDIKATRVGRATSTLNEEEIARVEDVFAAVIEEYGFPRRLG